jgi:hypothetical protein
MVKLATVVTLLLMACTAWGQTRSEREADPLQLAVREITVEAQRALRENTPFPRDASTFFANAEKREGIDVDRVIDLLIHGTDRPPRVEAYVRWQLLSALPASLSAAQQARLAEAAVRAPAPIDMPGVASDERRTLDRLAQRTREAELDNLNAEWTTRINQVREQNEVILTYRDALVQRLTDSTFALKVRLDDLWARSSAGLDVRRDADKWAAEVRTWAVLAEPQAIASMEQLVKEYASRPPGVVYTTAAWTSGRGQWRSRRTGLDSQMLEELRIDLGRAVQNATPAR